ncbi:MAG: hypothetical protein ACRDPM_21770 [Solirubrobacteraceae bacterium]
MTTTAPIGGDPDFVDPAHGNYHLAASSPLIDAVGLKYLSTSHTDLDGNPRVVTVDHPYTPLDLGAYEYQPPTGTGNPGGGNPGGGNPGGGAPGPGPSGTPTGGSPGTAHHGSGNSGTSTPSHGSRSRHPATLKLTRLGRVRVTHHRISLRLSCSGTAACSPIKVSASVVRRHHRVTVGTLTTHLAAGHKATVTLTLNRTGRALLASRRHLTVSLRITVRKGARTLTVQTARVRLT